MPKSKHGKNHKKKVAEYKKQIQVTNKRLKEQKMKEFFEKIQSLQKELESSDVISDSTIDGDITVDTGGDITVDTNID